MRTIGILGGMSDKATVAYYQLMNAEVNRRLGGWHIAETVIVSVDFAVIERCVRGGHWDEAGDYLADRAARLERAGVDFVICATNTMHRVAPRFMQGIGTPFLHIVDPTAAAIRQAGHRCVALFGTKPVMAADFLKERFGVRHGIDILVPSPSEQDEIDRIIFDELVRGVVRPESKARYLAIADRLAKAGAQALILGCTEIFLLIGQSDRPALPMFDTTVLHATAAVDLALADDARFRAWAADAAAGLARD